MTGEAKKEVERFLLNGQKVAAIKYLKDTCNFMLDESKLLVEALEQQMRGSVASPEYYDNSSSSDAAKVRQTEKDSPSISQALVPGQTEDRYLCSLFIFRNRSTCIMTKCSITYLLYDWRS